MMDLSTRPRPRVSAADRVFFGLALAVTAWAAWGAVEARAELRHAREAVADAERDTDAAATRQRALDSKRTGEAERLVSRMEWTAAAPPPRVLADLTALLPPDVRLASLGLAYGEGVAVEAQIVARNAQAYDAFLDRLTSSPRFSNVEPGDEARDGEVLARVQMAWRSTQ
jgi:Tfp pilus assembly protein PilN